ncbi:YeeE/YedE family protein [Sphingomonas parva]|uniref:YeeE/YedE family protein n=1 Tax=Sphingomonas parva TaxID=2555898 RepID=A0A4Y8ZV23_9SPHN|nr:YeeE/YedE family protein [Sphingomonas parva]
MTQFTPISALAGGIMIGLSAVLLLLTSGRIAGISGILGGVLAPRHGDVSWRILFIAGLLTGPLLYALMVGGLPDVTIDDSLPLLVVAGLVVGFGTRLGSGCTSGHGVCGLARFSPRSLAATGIFFAVAVVTVFVSRHVVGV